ncbi:hypothetical protein [Pseudomonas sp. Pseusp16]|uniref:hypothetical protein n=1 Tax=Pseudomonas sp. Pseusp16 TaxID=3243021 RepID=UPI0039B476A2
MNKELALSSEAFGFIPGIFFIGYSSCAEQRAAQLVRRPSVDRPDTGDLGFIAALTTFAQTTNQAEVGFFPGIIVYLTYWFRSKELATTVALFTAAIPVSYIIGAPTSTARAPPMVCRAEEG